MAARVMQEINERLGDHTKPQELLSLIKFAIKFNDLLQVIPTTPLWMLFGLDYLTTMGHFKKDLKLV